ncbi:DNA polymerase III subunit delta' [soil metagenome]
MTAHDGDGLAAGDAFAGVAGRPAVVAQLRAAAASPVHAYLLIGPDGSGSAAAAAAFSAALLCPRGGCGRCRDCRLALAGEHPDVSTFAPEGAFLRMSDAEEIARVAARSPVEGNRKVLVLTDFHRVQRVGPALLKTIEEPPDTTVFVILADTVPPELVTIASRCVRIEMAAIPTEALVELLVDEGVELGAARVAAEAAGGSLGRARLLVADPGLAERRQAWALVPVRLDDTGAAACVVVGELLELVEAAAEPLRRAQAEETAALEERAATTGERGSGRSRVEASQRRALRRHRTEELRFGLATLGARYRDQLAEAGPELPALLGALDAITAASAALVRNPNETLLLQALLVGLPSLASRGHLP